MDTAYIVLFTSRDGKIDATRYRSEREAMEVANACKLGGGLALYLGPVGYRRANDLVVAARRQ